MLSRSYSDIAPKINSVPGFEFVWITDGIGWKSAKNKLQEAYSIIPSMMEVYLSFHLLHLDVLPKLRQQSHIGE